MDGPRANGEVAASLESAFERMRQAHAKKGRQEAGSGNRPKRQARKTTKKRELDCDE
jgi:hypothetical protein